VDGTIVFIDNGIDPMNEKHRARFIKALAKKVPKLDDADAERKLLDFAQHQYQQEAERQAQLRQPPQAPTPGDSPVELDVSRVIRPDLFITPEVTGLAVPVIFASGDRPASRWMFYLRWHDGKRECREL